MVAQGFYRTFKNRVAQGATVTNSYYKKAGNIFWLILSRRPYQETEFFFGILGPNTQIVNKTKVTQPNCLPNQSIPHCLSSYLHTFYFLNGDISLM